MSFSCKTRFFGFHTVINIKESYYFYFFGRKGKF